MVSFEKVNIAGKGLKEATKTNPLFVLFWAVCRLSRIVRAVRKKVLDKRTHFVFNKHNILKPQKAYLKT